LRWLVALSALFLSGPAVWAAEDAASATYVRGVLTVSVPYHLERAGAGKLTVELLDPEDHVLSASERAVRVRAGGGAWVQALAVDKGLPYEDLVWERVRYRLVYDDEAEPALQRIDAVGGILRRPELHVLAQRSYLAGSLAAMRFLVTDEHNEPLMGQSTVRAELIVGKQPARLLYAGKLDRRGTSEAQFRLPAGVVGAAQLRVVAETAIGTVETTESIQLQDKASLLLTTEKPLYQPGQTIHARVLALSRADHHAAANRPLTFELEDGRGNKVFKHVTKTDAFGIASAEFTLADEVNLGTYHLRALMGAPAGDDKQTATAELAINVERYVLPKFKVSVEFTPKDGRPRHDYRPGDHVTGTVQANYFFGKPVDDAPIAVKVSAMDVAVFEAVSAEGRTDEEGVYHFDLRLPSSFTGTAMNQGAARVLVEATVTDSASHAETRGEPITVSQSAMLLTAVPEGGILVPGIDNRVFVLASYPDGTPAAGARLTAHLVHQADQLLIADASGIAVAQVRLDEDRQRAGYAPTDLRLEATDARGQRAASTVALLSRAGVDQVLVRADHAVYRAGDRMELEVLSTHASGAVYVDIVKDGQTIETRDLDLRGGRATLTLTATAAMAGTLDCNAYLFGRDAQVVGDHRLLFVQPADALKIEAVTDVPVYKPGEDARIRFHVTNARGEGVSAALGLQVVDEAVFALAEKQPGFAKVFFYLEEQVMKPRYEIHGEGLDRLKETTREGLGEPEDGAAGEQRDRAAQVLFSASEGLAMDRLRSDVGVSLPEAKHAAFERRYAAAYETQAAKVTARLTEYYGSHPNHPGMAEVYASLWKEGSADAPTDAWGTPLQLSRSHWGRDYLLRSAGPDRKFGTADDLTVTLEEEAAASRPMNRLGGAIESQIEHDRGPFNGRAEVTGTVRDGSGAAIPRATIRLQLQGPGVRPTLVNTARTSTSNARGEFTLTAVPPGRYTVQISSNGFSTAQSAVTLAERDLATLTATLNAGAVNATVMVTATNADLVTMNAATGVTVDGLPAPPPPMARMAPLPMIANRRAVAGMAAGMGAMSFQASDDRMKLKAVGRDATGAANAAAEPAAEHIRSYFPEALFIAPEILTDAEGRAEISIPVADSITTWRMAMVASTQGGALGSATSGFKVFQDFFVDLDLPVTLTQGDRVSLPVAIYNYGKARGDVALTLQPEDWFTLVDDTTDKSVAVDANRVGAAQYTLEARHIGKFKLTLSAHLHGAVDRVDTVVREIEVVPNGQPQEVVFNGRLDAGAAPASVEHVVQFPQSALPEASKLFVRVYPGPLSQIVEGMDGILRMPGGCFEQTSSSTYPNVLALDYLKRTKKLTPEVHAKAEGYIANGYQRLLTFEVPGGGFSWFGQAPANKILTAYGLMEFSDMARVYDVDPRLVERTRNWLVAQQQADGSWRPDTQFINEGATNRYNSDALRITAYIAWSLEVTGYRGPAVEKARSFLAARLEKAASAGSLEDADAARRLNPKAALDAYTLAVLANFAVEGDHGGAPSALTHRVLQLLLDARQEQGEQMFWSAAETGMYGSGKSAAIETTGLVVQALLRSGDSPDVVRRALAWLAAQKSGAGNWGTTQATIMALRALLLASEKSGADARGTVEVLLNGAVVQRLSLTSENNDLLQQMALPNLDPASNRVALRFTGSGGIAYQVAGRYFTPWPQRAEKQPLEIAVSYDRSTLARNDVVVAKAVIHSNLPATAKMVMVDLGIPPGFDLLSEDLQSLVEKTAGMQTGRLEKFSLTATQAILYFNGIAANATVEVPFRLRAKYPIRAKTFASHVYEYYDPAIGSTAQPVQLVVKDQ